MFTQGDSSYQKKHQGSGLGLGIVRKLVDELGGNIEIQSTYGEGTKTTITLPFGISESLSLQQKKSTRGDEKKNLAPVKVLIAEDNEVNQRVLSEMLKKDDHDVVIAGNGKEAIALVKRHKPDIVFMDIQMPDMDGVVATKNIRSFEAEEGRESIPIIALTGYDMPGDVDNFLAAGMNGHMLKPISIKKLRKVISCHV